MFEKFGYNNYVWNTYIFYRNIFKQYKIKLITLNDTNVIVVLSNFSISDVYWKGPQFNGISAMMQHYLSNAIDFS